MGRRRAAGQLSLCPVLNALTCMYDDERKKRKKKKRFCSTMREREMRFEMSICVARQRQRSTDCAKHIGPEER